MQLEITSRMVRVAAQFLILQALVFAPVTTVHAQKAVTVNGRADSGSPVRCSEINIRPFPSRPSRRAIAWANAQMRRMSRDEKIGQLISIGVNGTFLNQDSDAYRALRRQIEDNHVGGVVLFQGTVYESVHLVNRMQQLARYPLLVSADMEFGAAMRFSDTVGIPWNMAVGATGNYRYAKRQGEIIAREAHVLGVKQIFGPVADVNNNAANPVINVRSYGENPVEVARFVVAFIEGAQGCGAIATAKHFPGHGDTSVDSHRGLPIIDVARQRLDSVELVPFRAAITAGVGSIMVAYVGLPQIDPTPIEPLKRASEIITEKATLPTALSPTLLDGLLRRDLGFDRLVVTDALDMSGLTNYFSQDEAAVRAIEAGADMLIKPSDVDAAVNGLRRAIEGGRLTERRIEQSVRAILAAKYDLGLLRQRFTPLDQIDRLLSDRETVAFAQEVAERAITLVRNDSGLVPVNRLQPGARIFNLAITNGDDRLWITTPFVTALTNRGLHVETVVLDERSSDAEINRALELAQSADVTIASLYGRVRSGESRSIDLPEAGVRVLTSLVGLDVPLVGISFGNPYLLQHFPQIRTYMVAYGDMSDLQQAAARALLGETDITGRLPITLSSLHTRGSGIQLKSVRHKAH